MELGERGITPARAQDICVYGQSLIHVWCDGIGKGLRFASRSVGAGLAIWFLIVCADDDDDDDADDADDADEDDDAERTDGLASAGRSCSRDSCAGDLAEEEAPTGAAAAAELQLVTAGLLPEQVQQVQQHQHQQGAWSGCIHWLRVALLLGSGCVGVLLLYYAVRIIKAWKQATLAELIDLTGAGNALICLISFGNALKSMICPDRLRTNATER